MSTPNLQKDDEEKLNALEERLGQLSPKEEERVRKIAGMYECEWNKDREPEYTTTIRDLARSFEYALDFVANPRDILVLDRTPEGAISDKIKGVLVGYSTAVRKCESLKAAIDTLPTIKYRVVISDSAAEDQGKDETFLSTAKKASQATSTILMLGKDEEVVDTRGVDLIVRKPIDSTDQTLLDKIILACVRSDIFDENEGLKEGFGFVVPQPPMNFLEYEGVLEEKINKLEGVLAPRFKFGSSVPRIVHTASAEYPGAANGKLFGKFKKALEHERKGGNVVLYVDDLNSLNMRDLRVLRHATGIIFRSVSRRSHHAIDLMSAGIPMIKCENSSKEKGEYLFGKFRIGEGGPISFDGLTGEIYGGTHKVFPSPITNRLLAKEREREEVEMFDSNMRTWDEVLRERIRVMINADSTDTIDEAIGFGVHEVGLVRSENILKAKLSNVEKYCTYFLALCAGKKKAAQKARRAFKKVQADAFYTILKHQQGRRTQIRLLDAPFNEFFDNETIDKISSEMEDISKEDVERFKERVNDPIRQKEERGVVIGVNYPDIYAAQIEALFEAYTRLKEEGHGDIDLKIFIPYVYNIDQVRHVRNVAERINTEQYGDEVKYSLGVTLETVGGVMSAHKMLEMGIRHFTFGTNDLFPLIESKERDRRNDDYTLVEGMYVMNPAIAATLRSCLQNMAATGISRDQYEVGISGEMNPIKLENLKEIVPGLDYISASRALQIPVLKLKLAQIYVERAKNEAVNPGD